MEIKEYLLIVAGGRDFSDYERLKSCLDRVLENLSDTKLKIVCGMARGADLLGLKWAVENNIEVLKYPADWETYGKSAGYKRNSQMAEVANGLLAFWDEKSKGTKMMIELMKGKEKDTCVIYY